MSDEAKFKVINPNEPTDNVVCDPLSIFDDLEKLKVAQSITVERHRLLSSCRCAKPDGNLYFRSSPKLNHRLIAPLIRHKQERDLYFFVAPQMREHPHVKRHMRYYTLVLISTWPSEDYQLWPVPLLVGDKPIQSDKTQNDAFEKSLRYWTQIAWDKSKRDYNVEIAERTEGNTIPDPVWPEKEPFNTFLKLAFSGNIIDTPDYEYVRQLRGIT